MNKKQLRKVYFDHLTEIKDTCIKSKTLIKFKTLAPRFKGIVECLQASNIDQTNPLYYDIMYGLIFAQLQECQDVVKGIAAVCNSMSRDFESTFKDDDELRKLQNYVARLATRLRNYLDPLSLEYISPFEEQCFSEGSQYFEYFKEWSEARHPFDHLADDLYAKHAEPPVVIHNETSDIRCEIYFYGDNEVQVIVSNKRPLTAQDKECIEIINKYAHTVSKEKFCEKMSEMNIWGK